MLNTHIALFLTAGALASLSPRLANDGAGDGVEIETGGYLASVVFPTFEHVHGITEFPIRPAERRGASVSRIGVGDRCGMRARDENGRTVAGAR